ncbi:MAG: class I SAM-dependent methyltransferase [Mariprofundus sp.]|nr:class I SAM-dependent methyltransferase [Mariprofundus sp.]
MHKPIDNNRWQASQKLSLQAWDNKNLATEREQLERSMLPILQRYAKKYPESATILEIGCGPVCLASLLAQQCKTYLDPMADDFRRMFPGELPEDGEYLTSAAERIPKPSGSYDLIICLNMISHTLNPELVMNEIERLLKPGGKLILSIRTHNQLEARLHYLTIRMFPQLCSKTRPYYYTRKGIRRTLQRHFNIKEEIVQKAHAIRMPFCKRQQHVFVCTPLDSAKQTSL